MVNYFRRKSFGERKMDSYTKNKISKYEAKRLFEESGIGNADSVSECLNAEFSPVFKVKSNGKVYYIKFGTAPESATLTYEKDLIKAELAYYDALAAAESADVGENDRILRPSVVFRDVSREKINVDYFISEGFDASLQGLTFPNLNAKRRVMFQLGQNLAKLHRLKGEGFGYAQLGTDSNWADAFKKMVDRIVADATVLKVKLDTYKIYEVINRAGDILKDVEECTFVNGAVTPDNVFVNRKNFTYQGLINWSRAFYGDYVTDLISLYPTRSLERNRYFVKGYNSVAPFNSDNRLRVRANLMRMYLGMVMMVELEIRWKKNSARYIRHKWLGRRLLRKALSALQRPFNDQTKGNL